MHVGCYIALMISYLVAALAYGLLLIDTVNHIEPKHAGEEIAAIAPSDAATGEVA